MSERFKILFLTGCMFVVGLNLEGSIRLVLEGWFGPYRAEPVLAQEDVAADAVAVSAASSSSQGEYWVPGNAPGL